MKSAIAFIVGLVFGVGLIVSGMANPAKVLGFLDVAGEWDPSLAFVMVGAIGVGLVGFAVAGRLKATLFGWPMHLPHRRAVDRRVIAGGLLFGAGWGLAGFCPGPAVVALGAGYGKAAIFVAAMLGGMAIFDVLQRADLRVFRRTLT